MSNREDSFYEYEADTARPVSDSGRGPRPSSELRWWWGLIGFVGGAVCHILFSIAIGAVIILSNRGQGGTESLLQKLMSPAWLSFQVALTSGILALWAMGLPKVLKVSVKNFLKLTRPRPMSYLWSLVGMVACGFLVDEALFLLHSASPELFSTDGLAAFGRSFAGASVGGYILLTVIVALGPGIGEELMFRGLVLRSFVGGMPAWAAVLLSSALFGLLHWNMLQGVGAGLIGVYLGLVTLVTGSLWPAVIAHAANNTISSLFARYSAVDSVEVFKQGHPMWLVCAAAAATGFAVWQLVKARGAGEES